MSQLGGGTPPLLLPQAARSGETSTAVIPTPSSRRREAGREAYGDRAVCGGRLRNPSRSRRGAEPARRVTAGTDGLLSVGTGWGDRSARPVRGGAERVSYLTRREP